MASGHSPGRGRPPPLPLSPGWVKWSRLLSVLGSGWNPQFLLPACQVPVPPGFLSSLSSVAFLLNFWHEGPCWGCWRRGLWPGREAGGPACAPCRAELARCSFQRWPDRGAQQVAEDPRLLLLCGERCVRLRVVTERSPRSGRSRPGRRRTGGSRPRGGVSGAAEPHRPPLSGRSLPLAAFPGLRPELSSLQVPVHFHAPRPDLRRNSAHRVALSQALNCRKEEGLRWEGLERMLRGGSSPGGLTASSVQAGERGTPPPRGPCSTGGTGAGPATGPEGPAFQGFAP